MKPVTRKEMFMNALCGGECPVEPATREEMYLARMAESAGGGGGAPVVCVFQDTTDEASSPYFLKEITEWVYDSMQRPSPATDPEVLTPGEVLEMVFGKREVILILYQKKLLGGVAAWGREGVYLCLDNTDFSNRDGNSGINENISFAGFRINPATGVFYTCLVSYDRDTDEIIISQYTYGE